MATQQPTLAELDSALHHMLDENETLRAELTQLRAENRRLVEWINGDTDALAVLQRTYLDPETSTSDRIKAATSAIAYERPKLTVQLHVGPAVLGDRLDAAKAMKTISNPSRSESPALIEHQS
jgi:hypothetical protein